MQGGGEFQPGQTRPVPLLPPQRTAEPDLAPPPSFGPPRQPAPPAVEPPGADLLPPPSTEGCDQQRCVDARERIRAKTIQTISLDIIPVYKPDTEDEVEAAEAVRRRLAQMPSRQWHDRNGQKVAEGRIADYRNRRVIIENKAGQTVPIPISDLSDDDVCFVTTWWELPGECRLGDEQFAGRCWTPLTMTWTASALCHKPLYFEDVQLERYGHSAGPLVQPIKSGAHFFLNIATLPYQFGMNPPTECQYALGYYRPGDCAPWLIDPIPLSLRGAALQAGVVVGGIYLLP